MSGEFKNESSPVKASSNCGNKPAMLRTMLNPVNGCTVRMFKCECGEQTWSEDKK